MAGHEDRQGRRALEKGFTRTAGKAAETPVQKCIRRRCRLPGMTEEDKRSCEFTCRQRILIEGG